MIYLKERRPLLVLSCNTILIFMSQILQTAIYLHLKCEACVQK